ncbi:glycine rich domain-containing protein [Cohnella fermenti]|nr:glycine rich domain-containing protein [Cohnella fermenti]
MILDIEGLDVIDTLPNGQYMTGTSTVFYQLEMSYGTGSRPYSTAYNSTYGANGVQFGSAYSNNHSKVNDVVIHNPVSSQYAMIMPLPADRDQRTTDSKALGGNLMQATVEYQKTLNPDYRQNLIGNGDAEILDSSTQVSGWTGYTTTPGQVSFTSRTGDSWVMAGTNSFEIRTEPNPGGTGTSYTGTYYRDVTIKANTDYEFTGSLSCHRCAASITLDAYDANGSLIQTYVAGTVSNTGTVTPITRMFTSPAGAVKLRVKLNKGAAASSSAASYSEHLFADNLVLTNRSDNEWIGLDDLYQTVAVNNPDYQPEVEATDTSFDFTGAVQTFTVPATGTYTLELWGAQGGSYSGSNGGHGGYSTGQVNLTKGETLYINVGGTTGTGAGGWNGGGSTAGVAKGGGGATDIRKGGQALTDRIIVAGGGGGGQAGAGGVGGGTTGGTGYKNCCGTVGSGGTQTAGGTGGGTSGVLGIGGNGATGSDGLYGGAGGGGYYGGGGANSDVSLVDDGGGGGGSGYIGGVIGGTTYDGASTIPSPSGATEIGHMGNGYVRITSERTAGGGEATRFDYTGAMELYAAPRSGIYTIQAWGASGGANSSNQGGRGGYSTGNLTLSQGDTLSLYIGEAGTAGGDATFGGGGAAADSSGASGGGASDVRTSGGIYKVNSGLYLRDGTTLSGTTATMNATNEGVYGPYITVAAGRYQVDVYVYTAQD